jgi:hypothetical protein
MFLFKPEFTFDLGLVRGSLAISSRQERKTNHAYRERFTEGCLRLHTHSSFIIINDAQRIINFSDFLLSMPNKIP